jgi:DNA polymerase III epsilon subunit-like protein
VKRHEFHVCLSCVHYYFIYTIEIFTDIHSNDLRDQKTLSEIWPQIIAFIRKLKPPVCIIAHNGVKFDFRVLAREMRRQRMEPSVAVNIQTVSKYNNKCLADADVLDRLAADVRSD